MRLRPLRRASLQKSVSPSGAGFLKLLNRGHSFALLTALTAMHFVLAGRPVMAASTPRIVAMSDTQAAGAPAGQQYGYFDHVSIDVAGEVAISGALKYGVAGVDDTNNTAIWAERNNALTLLAREDSAAPDMPAGYKFHDIGLPRQSGVGKTAFYSSVRVGTGGDCCGIWSEGNGSLHLVAFSSDQAPDTPAGAQFSDFSAPRINSAGQVAFYGSLLFGSGGVTVDNANGIWSGGSTLHLVARKGSQAAGAPAGALFNSFSSEDRQIPLNDAGQTAFLATLRNGAGGVTTGNNTGIWSEGGGALHLVARSGSPAPGTSGIFLSLGDPQINSAGQTAFYGSAAGGYGVWSEGGGELHLVAQQGSQPPGTPAGAQFRFFETLQFNNAGRTAFAAELLTGSGGVTSSNDTGIWSEGTGTTALVAREGNHAPGTPAGANFDEFCTYCSEAFALNGAGQTAFRAELITGSGGVDSTNNVGIWANDRAGSLQLIARSGDQLDIDPGPAVNLRTIRDLDFWGGPGSEGGRGNGLNDNGQLAFIATFLDYSYGVFVSDLVAAPALHGDFNSDGVVNAADYVVWRKTGGAQSGYNTWRANFGQSFPGSGSAVGSSQSSSTNVPEPASALLLVCGVLSLVAKLARCRCKGRELVGA